MIGIDIISLACVFDWFCDWMMNLGASEQVVEKPLQMRWSYSTLREQYGGAGSLVRGTTNKACKDSIRHLKSATDFNTSSSRDSKVQSSS